MDINKIIADSHQGLDFGVVTLFIKKHEGEVSTIDTQLIHTEKVENTTKALEMVLQLFKGMSAAKASGNVTFTVTFNGGDAKKVMVQDTKHHTAKKWGA
jgi:hypothetical protein